MLGSVIDCHSLVVFPASEKWNFLFGLLTQQVGIERLSDDLKCRLMELPEMQ